MYIYIGQKENVMPGIYKIIHFLLIYYDLKSYITCYHKMKLNVTSVERHVSVAEEIF